MIDTSVSADRRPSVSRTGATLVGSGRCPAGLTSGSGTRPWLTAPTTVGPHSQGKLTLPAAAPSPRLAPLRQRAMKACLVVDGHDDRQAATAAQQRRRAL